MKNASYILNGLKEAGYEVYGGVNLPLCVAENPRSDDQLEFFDYLLENAHVVGTPGSGFGPSGEHYFRLTAFGTWENTVKAVDRLRRCRRYKMALAAMMNKAARAICFLYDRKFHFLSYKNLRWIALRRKGRCRLRDPPQRRIPQAGFFLSVHF